MVGSGDDDTDYDDSVSQEESVGHDESSGHPVDWTLVRWHTSQFRTRGHSTAGTSDHARVSQVEDAAPVDTTLIPNYGGHVAKVIFEGSERTPPILECRLRKRMLDAIIRLPDMSDELYGLLPATPLGRLPYMMHQHIDSALITAFVERW
ncbi:uncharacterized protein LOC130820422 [Amaranthus tricolor]|uniref:uncharacterized protein LOC130820422 n=1 Tax=Amaranthus tricolor TaxID=29722 RepID=UPI00258EB7E6|nr:uncharacterized protein LOC130820422 [Amaranthus tricolor]